MSSVSIKDVDYGLAWMTVGIKRLRGQGVKVGVDDRPHEPTGQPTDEIGLYHEFGRGVPERSFLRAWIDEEREVIQDKMGELITTTLEGGGDWRGPFGKWCVAQVQQRINAGIAPALSDATLGRRPARPPLLDTHQLVTAVIYELEGE